MPSRKASREPTNGGIKTFFQSQSAALAPRSANAPIVPTAALPDESRKRKASDGIPEGAGVDIKAQRNDKLGVDDATGPIPPSYNPSTPVKPKSSTASTPNDVPVTRDQVLQQFMSTIRTTGSQPVPRGLRNKLLRFFDHCAERSPQQATNSVDLPTLQPIKDALSCLSPSEVDWTLAASKARLKLAQSGVTREEIMDCQVSGDHPQKLEALARYQALWTTCEPEIWHSFKQLLGVATAHDRQPELHVLPSGSLRSPVFSLGNYPPLKSNERMFGTASEPGNPTMRAMRAKLRFEGTYESMTKHTFYLENCFERLAVPKRSSRTYSADPADTTLPKAVLKAHEICRNDLLTKSEAVIGVVWGRRGAKFFKEAFPGYIALSLGDVDISYSNEDVLVYLDELDEIRRLVFLTYHPEAWLKHRNKISLDPSIPSRLDLAYNTAYAAIGYTDFNPDYIAWKMMGFTMNQVPISRTFSWDSLSHDPQRCLHMMRAFERANGVRFQSAEVPVPVLEYAKSEGWVGTMTTKNIIVSMIDAVTANPSVATRFKEGQRGSRATEFKKGQRVNAASNSSDPSRMDISEGDKKWKAAYEASGLDQKLAQQIRGAWDRTSITTAATYPGRLQSVGLKAHEISSLMPDHWKETYVEVFDAEVLARWRARYTNFGLTYSLGRAIGLSLSRVPTDVAVTYPACLRGIGLTVAEVNKILVNAGFDEYVLDDEQETSSAGDDEDEGYDGLEEIDDDVGGT